MRCHNTCAEKAFYTIEQLKKLKNWSEDVTNMLTFLQPSVNRTPAIPSPSIESDHYGGYLPSTIKSFRLEYMDVKGDPQRLEEWGNKKKEEFEIRLKWAETWKEWQYKCLSKARQAKNERRTAITNKFLELGWDQSLLDASAFRDCRLVNSPKSLTEAEWIEIKPALTKKLNELKATREYRHRFATLENAYTLHCKLLRHFNNRPLMPFVEFLMSPSAQEINEYIFNTNMDVPFTNHTFYTFLDAISIETLSDGWLREKEEELTKALEKRTKHLLSKVIFKCKTCHQVLWTPWVYPHVCGKANKQARTSPDWQWPQFNPFEDLDLFHNRELWHANRFEYDACRTAFVEQMLNLSGANDLEHLVEINPLFECLDCRKGGPQRYFYRWTSAVHDHRRSKNHKHHKLSISSYDEVTETEIKDMESSELMAKSIVVADVECKLCPPAADMPLLLRVTRDKTPLFFHMKSQHELSGTKVNMGEHWRWKMNAPNEHLRLPSSKQLSIS
ncbi:hypothetical protein V5O48_004349 [Marasmius crinis-equi]|uniref:Uncharacterized protein n=1 Tax=Marasmius crinis-equi TaxID=585013 RepID=A0ABR3FQA6_9AGAR